MLDASARSAASGDREQSPARVWAKFASRCRSVDCSKLAAMQQLTQSPSNLGVALPRANTSLQRSDHHGAVRGPLAKQERSRPINVHGVERAASVIAGAWLIARSLRRPSLRQAPAALAGAAFLYRGVSGHCHTYAALGVNTAHRAASRELDLHGSITIGKSAEELYRLWQQPGTLPKILGHVAEIELAPDGQSHWRVRGPLQQILHYTTRVVQAREPELIRWESAPGAQACLTGAVSFKPASGDWGTEVKLHLTLVPPAGQVGVLLAKALGPAPELLLRKGLRRFKGLAETGEIPSLSFNPAARAGGRDHEDKTRRT
ncbi:MAG: Polyketide cyclase / dehydrase and lipid transport [Polyangiaceae bacterium]|jgi:uncharacterized membrane protein|nr:Polyketide cyclase / dehydrase and lipid transport [Polyangiaceae bacterium]